MNFTTDPHVIFSCIWDTRLKWGLRSDLEYGSLTNERGFPVEAAAEAVHGINDSGKPVPVKPKVARTDLLSLIAQLPPRQIGIEACSGAVSTQPSRRLAADCLPLVHHWARLFRQHGHTVKLMVPKPASWLTA